jgi:hypothetical protein
MNNDKLIVNNSFNDKKYYFKYSEYNDCEYNDCNSNNHSWNFVRKSFCLNFIKNDNILQGQFLTSNWFQIPIKIDQSYIFKIYSISNSASTNSDNFEFVLGSNIIKENINKMNSNDKENKVQINIYNNYGKFSINLRSYFHDNKEILLINLPEFNLIFN